MIDGLEGCLDLSHGRIAVLKADLEGRERGVIRLMVVRGLRRVVLGAIEVAIVHYTCFQTGLSWCNDGGRLSGRCRVKRARTAEIRTACE